MINLPLNDSSTQPRSSFSSVTRRQPLPWEPEKPFRILSIDGGGIKGIFPAAFLAEIETNLLNGRSVAEYFDLITGTSTGGILALGLASGITAEALRDLYINRGKDIFPPVPDNFYGKTKKFILNARSHVLYRYEREALHKLLVDAFGTKLLKDVNRRLCIPAFEGRFSDVYIFKTPHHPDYRQDAKEKLITIAEATSAAPVYFKPHQEKGYTFIDGGVWANNPTMIALIDALACFQVNREQIQILSIGCGDEPYYISDSTITKGGILHWRKIIFAAMHLQSLNALGQAKLLIGPENLLRISPSISGSPIELDDWRRAKQELPPEAMQIFHEYQDRITSKFFTSIAEQPHFYS
jgi:hypothetical protein